MMNAPEGSYLPVITGNPMIDLNPNSVLFANPLDQMSFDGTLDESVSSSLGSKPFDFRSESLRSQGFDVSHLPSSMLGDEARFPAAFVTPMPDHKPQTLITPIRPTLNEGVKSAILMLNRKIMDGFIIAILCVCDR